MKNTHDIDVGWAVPQGYKRREIFLGKKGRVEVEAIACGIRVRNIGSLNQLESSRCLDWLGYVVSSIRAEVGQ